MFFDEKLKINKKKIINDPLYGLISIPNELVYDVINHPYFQRLRHIKQLGLSHLVYPGALHTRFHHAIGAMHLMIQAVDTLKAKGIKISPKEAEGVILAILLHDIGHGPFSHSLEYTIIKGINHEEMSLCIMELLNKTFKGKLTIAIQIFQNKYPKKFLHQLVSSQLDMDRLDYLNRDSFFTGVSEGIVGSDRIIKMLAVENDTLVVEAKGIYSIEKFLIARRLMYWQVYLHKTVLGAEKILINILTRAKELQLKHPHLFATPALKYFLQNNITNKNWHQNSEALTYFLQLDDHDIMSSIKVWVSHEDKVLSILCHNLIARNLYKVEIQNEAFSKTRINTLKKDVMLTLKINPTDLKYFVFTDSVNNSAYNAATKNSISVLFKNHSVLDVAKASDQLNLTMLSNTVTKQVLFYPKIK